MRLFFALPIDNEHKLAIEHWRNRVFPRDIRPVPIDNYHVTLHFLGEIKATQLDRLCSCAAEAIDNLNLEPLKLEIDQCGYWTGSGILWIGPEYWTEHLNRLQRKLAGLSGPFGVSQSKRAYQPHITLFRSKQPLPKPLLEPNFEIAFDEVVLYESVQKKNGVQYERIESWPIASFKPASPEVARPLTARRRNLAKKPPAQ